MSDPINPAYYGAGTPYEVFKVIDAWGVGFYLGNVLKYVRRAGQKTPDRLEDLKKAMRYLQHEIDEAAPVNEKHPPPQELRTSQSIIFNASLVDLNRRLEALEAARAMTRAKILRIDSIEQQIEQLEHDVIDIAGRLEKIENWRKAL